MLQHKQFHISISSQNCLQVTIIPQLPPPIKHGTCITAVIIIPRNIQIVTISFPAKKTAKASVNSASFFSMYQPKEPDVLKKKEKK